MRPRPSDSTRPDPRDEDEELIVLVRMREGRADAAAERMLYLRFQPHITRWVAHLNRHGSLCQPDLEDFLQDTYGLLLEAARRYDPARRQGGHFGTFLELVIARRFHNRVRQRHHAQRELWPRAALDRIEAPRAVWPCWTEAAADPARMAEAAELNQHLRSLEQGLSDRERYVWKAVAAGRSTAAIAAHFCCSVRTANRLKHDTIARVRSLAGKELRG